MNDGEDDGKANDWDFVSTASNRCIIVGESGVLGSKEGITSL